MKDLLSCLPGHAVSPLALVLLLLLSFATAQAQDLPGFTEIVEQNKGAVVNISTTQTVERSRPVLPPGTPMPEFPEGSPFNDLFRDFFGDGEEDIEEFDSQSLGSGFIISAEGFVLTNAHVVRDADEILVRLGDRREYLAEVIGSDARSDIALLKIDAENLPVAEIGKSNEIEVGEWVLAMGSPFGFEQTATAGIVSATGRSLPTGSYVPFIQTDVAINPGNSGGPLFNLQGEVIGVNSIIFSQTGGFMGLSFAIPMDVAMNVAQQLRTTGRVTRGWLGVLIQDVTTDLAESFGLDRPQGALIARVLPDSPAEAAGIEVGDIVVEFDGTEIVRASDLPNLVGRSKIDEESPVEVIRDGKALTLGVEIGELPDEDELQLSGAAPGTAPGAGQDNTLGMNVTDLTSEQREQRDIGEGGVLVQEVTEGPAREAGIQQGDIILMLANTEIESVAQFREIASGLPATGRPVPLLIQRGNGQLFLTIQVTEAEAEEDEAEAEE